MPDFERPWLFTDEEKDQLIGMLGWTLDRIEAKEASRKADYDAMKEQSRAGMSEDEAKTFFFDKYGFDHECRCVEDEMLGRTVEVSYCFSDMVDGAMIALEEAIIERDALAKDAELHGDMIDQLRLQVAELGATPRV